MSVVELNAKLFLEPSPHIILLNQDICWSLNANKLYTTEKESLEKVKYTIYLFRSFSILVKGSQNIIFLQLYS